MNNEQIQELIKQLKAAGLDDEKIMEVFYETFTDGKMDRKDLETLASALGYELTDDFKNDPTPDPIASKNLEGVSEEELKDAQTIEDGESVEKFKEETEETKSKIADDEEVEDDTEDEDEDEVDVEGEKDEKEWEKAQKLFRL